MIKRAIRKVTSGVLLACLAVLLPAAAVAADGDWELTLTASTPAKAKNRIYLGQKADATDWYDAKYDGDALLDGVIKAYFPHPEWGRTMTSYWRDIMGRGQNKKWTIKVECSTAGETITMSWDNTKLPAGYRATFTDSATNTATDMTAARSYAYANTGPREFTVETMEPVAPAETTPPVETIISQVETIPPVEQAAPVTHYAISGKVTDSRKKGVSGVTVAISTEPGAKVTTDSDGSYTFTNIAPGSYTVTPSMSVKDRFSPLKKDITIDSKDVANANFTLKGRR